MDWGKKRFGQNMAWGHGTFVEAIYDWFNEYKVYLEAGANPLILRFPGDPELVELGLVVFYDPAIQLCLHLITNDVFLQGKDIGHFLAMVWSNTSKIGCFKVFGPNFYGKDQHIYGCNYHPMGLIVVYF